MSAAPTQTQGCYLVEWYAADLTGDVLDRAVARICTALVDLGVERTEVALLGALVVPSDQVGFCLFAATSGALVEQTCRRAGVPLHRIAPATLSGCPATGESPARAPAPPLPPRLSFMKGHQR